MMESKIEKKNFGIAEFTEEEKWLEEHHNNGWSVIKTNRSKYQFERCDADEWIYQIDFKENGVAEEDYIQMFKDCGWEYVLQYGRWCYFRKKKEDGADLSIFTTAFKGDSFWDGAAPWIGGGLFVATSFSVNQYIKLRKMVKELK